MVVSVGRQMEASNRSNAMTPDNQPAWLGLFPDHDFEFHFGAGPDDVADYENVTEVSVHLLETLG